MPTSALVVRMDGSEYSRYYEPLRTMTIHVHATGAANGVVASAKLVREDGFGTVVTKTGVIASEHVDIRIDLAKDCADADGIFRARQGQYHVTVTMADNQTAADTAQFWVMAVPVAELKERFLQGIDLVATDIVTARHQPRTITGVTIKSASSGQFKGIFSLVWDGAGKFLQWNGGAVVAVDMTAPVLDLDLIDADQTAYINVSVITENLPAGNVVETIILDNAQITDDTLRRQLVNAYGFTEGKLNVRLEPQTLETEAVGSAFYDAAAYADEYVPADTYYRGDWYGRWFHLKLPHPWILKVHRLDAFFNTSRVATILVDNWVVVNRMAGALEFVPKTGALLSWVFYGVPSFAFMTTFAHIPSFWHYRLTCGLPDLRSDGYRQRARDAIAKFAAMDALVLAGLATAPGVSGESTSRDGVSESRQYADGPGGRFAMVWKVHHDFLLGEDGTGGPGSEVAALKQKLLGIVMTTL